MPLDPTDLNKRLHPRKFGIKTSTSETKCKVKNSTQGRLRSFDGISMV